jgi:Flp pilus assembly pilin Flp
MRPLPKPIPLRRHSPQRQRGVTTMEYIVLGAVLVLGLVAGVSMFKGSVGESLQTEGEALSQVASGSIAGVRDRYGDGAGGPGAGTGQSGQALGAGQEPERRVGDGWRSSGPREQIEFSDTDGDGVLDNVRVESSQASTARNDEFFGGKVKTEVGGKEQERNAEAGVRVDNDTLSANLGAERNVASGHANARVGDVLGLEAEALVGHEQVEAHGGAGLYGAGGKVEAEASAVQGKVAYSLGDEVNPFFRSELEGKLVSERVAATNAVARAPASS